LDGGQHADQIEYDTLRTAYRQRMGLRVRRVWNSELLTNRSGVCLGILDACTALASPAPAGEGRVRAGS